ncbi:hypothetical protein H0H93_009200 [Arthromyces matolae]|nr:hypothetical protein H0H93_009200 [Arthromyces matolae]
MKGEDHPSSIQLVTWNLHHKAPCPGRRMFVALRHLETYVFKCTEGQIPVACCIMFQEVHKEALQVILDDEWIRKHFVVTPINGNQWKNGYGNVTLVANSVAVVYSAVLKFGYSNNRDPRGAIIVDLKVTSPKAIKPQEMVLRMVNTHLEPGPTGVRMRRVQLGVLASLLRKRDAVRGGVVVGGMVAISEEDEEIPFQYNLKDAYLLPSKHPAGTTWGKQDSSEFPEGRLDRVLYVERHKSYTVEAPKYIGKGLKVYGPDEKEYIGWVSDHFGLLTRLLVQAR